MHSMRIQHNGYDFSMHTFSSKSNKNRTNSQHDNIIYYSNGYIIIPSEIFENICSSANLQLHKLKRALYQNGMITCSDSLYVSKLTVYPPGLSSKRINAYVIKDTIADEKLINPCLNEKKLALTPVEHTLNPENGFIIGYDYQNNPIIWSYRKLPTSHVLITGKSGYGKTTLIQKILPQLSDNNEKTAIFDISGSYIHSEKLSSLCSSYEHIIPVNPFAVREKESKTSFCNRITRNIAGCFRLSVSSENTLYSLLDASFISEKGIDLNLVDQSFNKLRNRVPLLKTASFIKSVLENSENRTWSDIFADKNISVISIDDSFAEYQITAEFLLNDLFEYKQNYSNDRMFIVIDEIQNLIKSDKSAIIQILSQGREAGIGLIMSTQSFKIIPNRYKSMFLQSGLNIFFQPELTAVEGIAKLIHSDLPADVISSTLKDLDIGKFLIYGSVEDKSGILIPDCVLYAGSEPGTQKADIEATYAVQIKEKTNSTDLSFTIIENPQIAP